MYRPVQYMYVCINTHLYMYIGICLSMVNGYVLVLFLLLATMNKLKTFVYKFL